MFEKMVEQNQAYSDSFARDRWNASITIGPISGTLPTGLIFEFRNRPSIGGLLPDFGGFSPTTVYSFLISKRDAANRFAAGEY